MPEKALLELSSIVREQEVGGSILLPKPNSLLQTNLKNTL
jgi:hypothetical protein